jgi:hypothetical protein
MKRDDSCLTCARMTVAAGEAGKLRLAAGKKRVHVQGAEWKASADEIDVCGDGRVVLHGHVKLACDKIGACAKVKAAELCVQVRHGKFEKILSR